MPANGPEASSWGGESVLEVGSVMGAEPCGPLNTVGFSKDGFYGV